MERRRDAATVLRNLESDRLAADGILLQIKQLESDMVTLSEMGYIHAQGEKITPENRMRALIDEKARLVTREKVKREHVLHVERVMKSLPERQRTVLEVFYCSNYEPGEALRRLERQLNVEQAQIYNIRRRALRNFATRIGYV